MAEWERRVVEAAGGVVWRRDDSGAVVLLVAYRPRYDDWTFPKGKRDRTDADLTATARREVREETGFDCAVGDRLATTEYDSDGRPKRVTYWVMTVAGGEFAPNDEVDAIRWLGVTDAAALLTYDRDRAVLDAFVAQM